MGYWQLTEAIGHFIVATTNWPYRGDYGGRDHKLGFNRPVSIGYVAKLALLVINVVERAWLTNQYHINAIIERVSCYLHSSHCSLFCAVASNSNIYGVRSLLSS